MMECPVCGYAVTIYYVCCQCLADTKPPNVYRLDINVSELRRLILEARNAGYKEAHLI